MLKRRSVTGRSRKRVKPDESDENQTDIEHEPFTAMSPNKKKIIYQEFTKRIKNPNIPIQEQLHRLKNNYVSQLIVWGIGNFRKRS